MNPMQNSSSIKATSKWLRRAKGKKKKDAGVNDAQVAETPSEFSFTVFRTAVAQICQSVGYKHSNYNALETLTNVSIKYMQAIAASAGSYANLSNRTDSNLFDVINGIHDLCSVQGFPSGSQTHKCSLLKSGALKDIMNFVNLSNEVPFAKPVQFKNISGNLNPEPTIDSSSSMCSSQEEKMLSLHIPRWLPVFPTNCDKALVQERKCGEKLWEQTLAAEDVSGTVEENRVILPSNGVNRNKEKDAKMKLTKGRRRVMFKIGGKEEKQIESGVNMMNGVCKGRKRVSWNHGKINDCMVEEIEDKRSGIQEKRTA